MQEVHQDSVLGCGLTNPTGDQNCFLNVIIQALWHLSTFREVFLRMHDHQHSPNCVVCSLQDVLRNMSLSNSASPLKMREVFALEFASAGRFGLG
jgi:hypothetical protein